MADTRSAAGEGSEPRVPAQAEPAHELANLIAESDAKGKGFWRRLRKPKPGTAPAGAPESAETSPTPGTPDAATPSSPSANPTTDQPSATTDQPSATTDKSSSTTNRSSSTTNKAASTTDKAASTTDQVDSTVPGAATDAPGSTDEADTATAEVEGAKPDADSTDNSGAASDRADSTDDSGAASDRADSTDSSGVASGKAGSASGEVESVTAEVGSAASTDHAEVGVKGESSDAENDAAEAETADAEGAAEPVKADESDASVRPDASVKPDASVEPEQAGDAEPGAEGGTSNEVGAEGNESAAEGTDDEADERHRRTVGVVYEPEESPDGFPLEYGDIIIGLPKPVELKKSKPNPGTPAENTAASSEDAADHPEEDEPAAELTDPKDGQNEPADETEPAAEQAEHADESEPAAEHTEPAAETEAPAELSELMVAGGEQFVSGGEGAGLVDEAALADPAEPDAGDAEKANAEEAEQAAEGGEPAGEATQVEHAEPEAEQDHADAANAEHEGDHAGAANGEPEGDHADAANGEPGAVESADGPEKAEADDAGPETDTEAEAAVDGEQSAESAAQNLSAEDVDAENLGSGDGNSQDLSADGGDSEGLSAASAEPEESGAKDGDSEDLSAASAAPEESGAEGGDPDDLGVEGGDSADAGGEDVVLDEAAAAEKSAAEQAAMALITALMRLRGALASSKLPIDVVGADEARQQQKAMLDQLDDYILPRLVQLEAPVLAVVGGSTGAGKSTLVNSLIGQVVSEPGVLRPTTRSPVLIHNPVDAEWFTGDRVLPGMARSTGEKPGGMEDPGQIRLVAADTVPQGLAILDAPDIDSVVEANRELATQLLAAADLWLFVTTAARYADAVPWEFLQSASDRSTAVAVVLDRAPADTIDDITGHLAQMLLERGLGDSPLFSIKETVVDSNGMLPPETVASIKDWLIDLAADAEGRSAVVRRTLHGAVTAMTKKTPAFATAVRAQADTVVELRATAETAYERAVKDIAQATQDGTMLRGEVLARWQEFVGTGELLKGLQTNVGRLRDKVRTAVVGKPPPTRDLNDAVESGLESLLREHAEAAAERAEESWQSLAAGRQLLAAGDKDMGRMSKEFPAAASRAVREWQGYVLELVRKEGADKRSTARILAYGVNGLGLALMIVIFAHTAGLSGAEVGVGAGTAVVGQKLLEAVFGDQAVRTLAAKARADLDGRVHALMDAEFARYLAVLDQHPVDPDAPRRLTEAARAVEDCT
ncbi:dynamin family protein [Kribbella monticola]|uniref:dynamin family protein n=1 Tax=Kribbella monticola TaxID=2185285 RepID=UPI000DD4D0E4|nr:dynamin family protein [Kribbella monticola]